MIASWYCNTRKRVVEARITMIACRTLLDSCREEKRKEKEGGEKNMSGHRSHFPGRNSRTALHDKKEEIRLAVLVECGAQQ